MGRRSRTPSEIGREGQCIHVNGGPVLVWLWVFPTSVGDEGDLEHHKSGEGTKQQSLPHTVPFTVHRYGDSFLDGPDSEHECTQRKAQENRTNILLMSEELVNADIRLAKTLPSEFYTDEFTLKHNATPSNHLAIHGCEFAIHVRRLPAAPS